VGSVNLYIGSAANALVQYATGITGLTYVMTTAISGSKGPPAVSLVPSNFLASAALATHWPTSIAYMLSTPVPRHAYLEFFRHYLLYGSQNGNYVGHQVALNAYAAATGYPMPALTGYEGGIQVVTPSGIETAPNPDGSYLGTALTNDCFYDPAMYDVETAFYLASQQGGCSPTNIFMLAGAFPGANYDEPYVWSMAIYSSQPFGKGDGSLASNGTNLTNLFWTDTQRSETGYNATVRIKALNDWIDASSSPVVPGDVFVTPVNGATGVAQRAVIAVQFDEPMRATSITASTFTVMNGASSILGTIAYNPATWIATFTPTSALPAGATCVALLTTGVQNAQSVALGAPITWSFTVQAPSHTAPPPDALNPAYR
jgi:hypothetical protein